MPVSESGIRSHKVKTKGFIVVSCVHGHVATACDRATLTHTVGTCTVEAKRPFAIDPANPLVVLKRWSIYTFPVNRWSATSLDDHDRLRSAVRNARETILRIAVHD